MRLFFSADFRYRCFADPEGSSRIYVVSDVIRDDGGGQLVDGVLLFVFDAGGVVSDIELVCDVSRRVSAFGTEEWNEANVENVGVAVDVDSGVSVGWGFDREWGRFWLRLGAVDPDSWVRLGKTDLWLGCSGQTLVGMLFATAVLDVSGDAHDAWLNEIHADDQ